MKRLVVMLVCMTVCGATLFAQSLFSVGGGAILAPNFQTTKPKGGGDDQKMSGFGGGINLFFDATYAEANINLFFANEKRGENDDKGTDTTNLVIGLVGKFPLALGEGLKLFPFAGIDYRIALGASVDGKEQKDENGFKKADMFNALSVLFGVGVDYDITNALYFRGELGFGITFNTKSEEDWKATTESNFEGKVPIKLAVGYRF